MPYQDDVNDFLMGSGAKAFPFENMGDKVRGQIKEMKKTQQTDMQTGEPVFWNNGDPKLMLRITLQTDLQDTEDDEGMRAVYLRGGNPVAVKGKGSSSLTAVKDAVRRSGSTNGIEIDGWLELEFSGLGQSANKGFNPPKLYSATYQPPRASIDLGDMA